MSNSAAVHRVVEVLGTTLSYVEVAAAGGPRAPVLFLHGNPTSSHLWRHALALLAGSRRCVALDLVGMGGSGKPDLEYRLVDQVRYVDAVVDALGLQGAVLVGHDWGAVIAMDRLRRFPTQVPAIAVMEAHLQPLADWDAFDEGGLYGNPGALVTDEVLRRCIAEWPSLTTVDVGGPAGHFLPEDRPLAVAEALRDWIAELP